MRRAIMHCALAALPLLAPPAAVAQQHEHPQPAQQQPRQPIPPITDADRKAAFPADMEGHAVHDRKFNYYVLFDQLEWQPAAGGGLTLENTSWFGGDINRIWLRLDGELDDGAVETARGD